MSLAHQSRGRPRVRMRATGEGYEYVTDTDPHSGQERPVYVHRLAAIAWLLTDQEWRREGVQALAGRDVHHLSPIPWFNAEWNLELVEAREHRSWTLPQTRALTGVDQEGDDASS